MLNNLRLRWEWKGRVASGGGVLGDRWHGCYRVISLIIGPQYHPRATADVSKIIFYMLQSKLLIETLKSLILNLVITPIGTNCVFVPNRYIQTLKRAIFKEINMDKNLVMSLNQ